MTPLSFHYVMREMNNRKPLFRRYGVAERGQSNYKIIVLTNAQPYHTIRLYHVFNHLVYKTPHFFTFPVKKFGGLNIFYTFAKEF